VGRVNGRVGHACVCLSSSDGDLESDASSASRTSFDPSQPNLHAGSEISSLLNDVLGAGSSQSDLGRIDYKMVHVLYLLAHSILRY